MILMNYKRKSQKKMNIQYSIANPTCSLPILNNILTLSISIFKNVKLKWSTYPLNLLHLCVKLVGAHTKYHFKNVDDLNDVSHNLFNSYYLFYHHLLNLKQY